MGNKKKIIIISILIVITLGLLGGVILSNYRHRNVVNTENITNKINVVDIAETKELPKPEITGG